MGDKYFTVTEAADELQVSRQTINAWVKADRFPNSFEVGTDDKTLIPASDIETVRKEEADKLIAKLDRLGFQAVAA